MFYEIRLLSIKSIIASEDNGDELYIKHERRKVFPLGDEKYFKMNKENDIVKLNQPIRVDKLNTMLSFELWEYDYFLPNQKLGTFEILPTETGGPYIAELNKSSKEKCRYQLTWEVVTKTDALYQSKMNQAVLR